MLKTKKPQLSGLPVLLRGRNKTYRTSITWILALPVQLEDCGLSVADPHQ